MCIKYCAFSFKRKRTAWNRKKYKTVTLDTQVNFAKSDKGSFFDQKDWLEECEYGKGIFCSEYGDYKNFTSSEDNDSNWEESSSEEVESSDSNMEELPLQDKNIVVSVLLLERLICSLMVWKCCHESVSLKVQNAMYQHKLSE